MPVNQQIWALAAAWFTKMGQKHLILHHFFFKGSAQSCLRRPRRWRQPSSATSCLCTGSVTTPTASSWSTWRLAPWRLCWPPARCPGSSASASSTRQRWGWTSCTAWIHLFSTWTWSRPTSCWTLIITWRYKAPRSGRGFFLWQFVMLSYQACLRFVKPPSLG